MAAQGPPRFQNLVAIVTGGGSSPGPACSVGEATARLLAQRGAKVVVADINASGANMTVNRIAADKGEAVAAVADLSGEAECRRTVDLAIERFGRVDVLVNNLGVSSPGVVADIDEVDWDRALAINLKSALFMCKHAIPRMIDGGAIVNVSSIAIDKPGASITYSASKGALEALSKQIALQHGPDGVRCNVVRPGEIWTAMVEQRCPTEEVAAQLRTERMRRTALLTEGDAWDVAEAIVFFASPQARWITGQVLSVDGGSAFVRPSSDWTTRGLS